MTIEISELVAKIIPTKTILFFGAGASVPSNAPTAKQLTDGLAQAFTIEADGFSLSEVASLVEQKNSRSALVRYLRDRLKILRPTGGILNLPLYAWRSIFTTNYDTLVEQCYQKKNQALTVYSSNFDFTTDQEIEATKLFKLHGTIDKDVVDGHQSRMIVTEGDYDNTEQFREQLYDRLKGDLAGAHLIVIGHSLADADIKSIVERAAKIRASSIGSVRTTLLLYQRDDNRAQLIEKRGLEVCFGGIDHFFDELAKRGPATALVYSSTDDPLDGHPKLLPVTTSIEHALQVEPNVSAMFNGWPATYSDVNAGLTFNRSVTIETTKTLRSADYLCATLIGASGVGKTTTARQTLLELKRSGYLCYEHKTDHSLDSTEWLNVARKMHAKQRHSVLFVDEAHSHLRDVNELLDGMAAERLTCLRVLLASSRNQWSPRVKSPAIFKCGKEFTLSRLDSEEINRLLDLVEANGLLRPLIEGMFEGFSRYERRRRLTERCEADMFVCLKNIFASEKFDDIILREYAELSTDLQDVYRYVAAMESAGVRVHRQLVMRLLNMQSDNIAAALVNLSDIIQEYPINEREGVYGWKGRHSVIVDIISKYKFADTEQVVALFHKVIDCISPSYAIEVRTLVELCNVDSGIRRLPDRQTQNTLLRKMMSIAPGERVPRHRLIRNLIEAGEFEKAEAEIRIFSKDFKTDGPITRYKINLLTVRAAKTPGILKEDRLVILGQARDLAKSGSLRYPNNKHVLGAYCEVGLEVYRQSADFIVFDEAITALKLAEDRVGDPDISKMIARYDKMLVSQSSAVED
jgi:ABC-type oligopeptide transport system ATPase subunit